MCDQDGTNRDLMFCTAQTSLKYSDVFVVENRTLEGLPPPPVVEISTSWAGWSFGRKITFRSRRSSFCAGESCKVELYYIVVKNWLN